MLMAPFSPAEKITRNLIPEATKSVFISYLNKQQNTTTNKNPSIYNHIEL